MDINHLFQSLARVQSFQVEVTSTNEETAKGSGSVDIEQPDTNIIIWREKGRWNQCFNSLEFTNSYRWTCLENGCLELDHLRYGDQSPVNLVALVSNGKDAWHSMAPHLCGKDNYLLTLTPHRGGLKLVWRINGPDKDQISSVCYI